MAKNNNLTDFLTDIANTIREENGTTELINPQDFESKITEIADRFRNFIQGNLTNVEDGMLKGASNIRDYAFYYCKSLESIIIPDSVTSIGTSAFSNCTSLSRITIPKSVTSVGNNAFSGCSGLTEVHIEDLVSWCLIPFGNEYSNPIYYAKSLYLKGNKITDLVIPNDINNIISYSFNSCKSLTSVTIPNTVTSIDKYAFSNCSGLTSVTIPNSVTIIGNGAFMGCSGFTSIVIGNGVTSIGQYAFSSCSNLNSVVYKGQPIIPSATIFSNDNKISKYDFRNATSVPTIANKNFIAHATGCKIIVPDTLYDSWKAATNWKALTNVVWVKASEYTEE